MRLTPELLNEFFKGFTVQRWNDKIRTIELLEIDKHAHKMFVAYVLGKYEEDNGTKVNWIEIIYGGIFELLRRIIISDIKSPIYYRIQTDYPDTFQKLNDWVFSKIEKSIPDESLKTLTKNYLMNLSPFEPLSSKILDAAHIYASYWEFIRIIKPANPDGYQIKQIEIDLLEKIEQHLDLIGMRKLITRRPASDFIDLCGQLRFQIRWSQTPRLPRTSVLGHSIFVAIVSFLLSIENENCTKRLYNNFFGGLFHDLPEAVTRDIISPVKMSSKEFKNLIQNIETELSDREIMPLIEPTWHDEIKYFTREEFSNKVVIDNEIITVDSIDTTNLKYNKNEYSPIDGEVIRAADQLAAYLEAWNSVKLGINSEDFTGSMKNIRENYENRKLGNFTMMDIYSKI